MLRIAKGRALVGKVRAGHLPVGRQALCIFSVPPCIPPWGNSRPPAPQNAEVSGVKVAGLAPKFRTSPALCTAATQHSPALPRGDCRDPPVFSFFYCLDRVNIAYDGMLEEWRINF